MAAVACDVETQRLQHPRHCAADTAHAEHADTAAQGADRLPRPLPELLLRFVGGQAASVAQGHQRDELGDAVGLLGIDDARHLHLRRQLRHQQLVDAGTDAAHPAQPRQALHHAVRKAPAEHHLDVCQRGVVHAGLVLQQRQSRVDGMHRLGKHLGGQRVGQEQGLHAISPSATSG